MKLKYIISILLIGIVLIIFFYPKDCGNWGTAVHSDVRYKDCKCMGLKYSESNGGGSKITCLGIPTSYSCYYRNEGINESPIIYVPCE